MLQVKRIVNEIFSSNTYIVWDDEYDYCWLVDIGDLLKITDALPPNIEIRGVFLTHGHFDHIYGANALHRAYPHCMVYTSVYGKEELYNEKKNFSLYHETSFVYEGKDVSVLGEGDIVELYPNVVINIIATPGHCPSCLTYSIDKWLFTGDSYIPEVKVVTKLRNGNRELAKQSEERILKLAKGKTICPGHGEMVNKIEEN